jgi:hypothetical protein
MAGKNRKKKSRKKLRGQIKFQLNLTQQNRKKHALVSVLCEVITYKNHFIVIIFSCEKTLVLESSLK